MLQPIKQLVKRALIRFGVIEITPTLSAHEQRQQRLEQSCAFFREMASLADIAAVHVDQRETIVTLTDGRQYLLDADIKAARLYSVPFTGTFEPDETAFVRSFVKPGNVCIDVGANFGWFTVMLSRLAGAGGSVHAFEPITDTVRLLQRNVDINDCTNVDVNPIALDDRDDRRDIFVPDIGVSGSFALHDYRESYDTETVTTMTLDHYVEQHQLTHVDFIKADIEGAELNMLKGARRTLERFHPVLLLEVQASSTRLFDYEPADLIDFLAGFGYRMHIMTAQGTTEPLASIEDAPATYNFVFRAEAQAAARVA